MHTSVLLFALFACNDSGEVEPRTSDALPTTTATPTQLAICS